MKASRRQLRSLIESVMKEQQELGSAPSASGSEKELAGMEVPNRTFKYKNDGYTYIVINDMWHVIKGKKSMARKESDYISLEKYPSSLAKLDKAHPNARSSQSKQKANQDLEQKKYLDDLGKEVDSNDKRGKAIDDAFTSLKKELSEFEKTILKNSAIAEMTAGAAKSRGTREGSALMSLINTPEFKSFKTIHNNLKSRIEKAKKTQVADVSLFDKLASFEINYLGGLKDLKDMSKTDLGLDLKTMTASYQETVDAFEKISDSVDAVYNAQNSSNSSGTSGSSRVGAQNEGLSRGSLYRKRYWGRY